MEKKSYIYYVIMFNVNEYCYCNGLFCYTDIDDILSNIKYVFYTNTSIFLIDTTYVIQKYKLELLSWRHRLGMRENPSDVFVNIAESPLGKSQRTRILLLFEWHDVNYSPSLFTFLQIINSMKLIHDFFGVLS